MEEARMALHQQIIEIDSLSSLSSSSIEVSWNIVGLPTSIRQISTEPEVIPGKTVILVAEMINTTTAFVVWQPYPSHLVTGYEVVLKNNESSISTKVDAKVSEVFLKLNAKDFEQSYTVQIA